MIRHGFYQMIHSVNCVKQWAEVKVWRLYSSQPQSFPLDGVLLSCFKKKPYNVYSCYLWVSYLICPITECLFHCDRVHYRSERNSDMKGDFWSRVCVLRPMRCVSVVHSLMSVDYCWCRHVWNGSIFFFSACLFVAFFFLFQRAFWSVSVADWEQESHSKIFLFLTCRNVSTQWNK